jgi:hypothetical protein
MALAYDKSNGIAMVVCRAHFFAMVHYNSRAFAIVMSKIKGI